MTDYKKSTRLTSRLTRAIGDKIAPSEKGGRRLCILNYHRILESLDPLLQSDPDIKTFRWQMQLLADCFNVLPLHDAVLALAERRLPPRAVAITFDDGYRSFYDFALPILQEFNLPATIFITTGRFEEGAMWNDTIVEAIRQLPQGQLDLRDIGLGIHSLETLRDRKDTLHRLTETSKYLAPKARSDVTQKLEGMLCDLNPQGLMLTREQIASLARQGIEIGGHTVTHPILCSLDDEAARHEMAGCKQQLEEITGKPVRLFSYPNGKVGMDYDERHVRMAKECGYTAAFNTEVGAAMPTSDLFQLPRSRPWDATPFLFGLRLFRWLSSNYK